MANEHLTVEEIKSWRAKRLAEFQEKNKEDKMNKLQEILEAKVQILSEKKAADGDATMNVRVNWALAGAKTKNGRIYSKELLTREIDKLQEKVKKGGLIGTGDHNLDGFSNIKNASHIITKLEIDEDGKAWADLKIIGTERGKSAMKLIKNGAEIGVSQRGFGEVAKDGTVSDSFSLQGIDIVCDPSFSGGTLSLDNISESLNFEKKNPPSEELIKFVLEGAFQHRQRIGHKESYEEFMAEHGAIIRATVLSEHSGLSLEETLIEMGEEKTLRELKSEEKTHIYTDSECYIEARLMGISPSEMAKKLNLAEERKKIDRTSDFSLKEAQSLIAEAESAGLNLSDPKVRKEFLEKMAEMPSHEELTLEQRAKKVEKVLISEGKEPGSIEFIKKVLVFDDKQEETQKKRMAVKAMVENEMIASGAYTNREEMHRHVNRELRKRGLRILDEDGQ